MVFETAGLADPTVTWPTASTINLRPDAGVVHSKWRLRISRGNLRVHELDSRSAYGNGVATGDLSEHRERGDCNQ